MTTSTSSDASTGTGSATARNAACAADIYAAFGRGDVPAILDALADDVLWDADWPTDYPSRDGIPHLAPRRGPAEVAEFFALVSAWTLHDFQVLDIVAGERQGGRRDRRGVHAAERRAVPGRGAAPVDIRPGRAGPPLPALRRHGQARGGVRGHGHDRRRLTAAVRRAPGGCPADGAPSPGGRAPRQTRRAEVNFLPASGATFTGFPLVLACTICPLPT